MFGGRNPLHSRVQIMHHHVDFEIIINMKINQFLKDFMPRPAARMAKHLPARHHLEGDPAEPLGGPHARHAAIDPRGAPLLPQALEISITCEQIFSNHQDDVPVAFRATWHCSSELFGALHAPAQAADLVDSRDSNRVGRPG
jgi:hypothetical protein